MVILKAIQENGEEILSTLDSDEEMDAVYEEFMKEVPEFERFLVHSGIYLIKF